MAAHHLRLEGEHAQIVWAYHVAADVGRFVIEWGCIRATLKTCNPFRLTQSPLYFSSGPKFERQLLDVRVSGTTLTARIGPRRPDGVTHATTGGRADHAPR